MICRICNHDSFFEVIDLGKQPWGNDFLTPEQLGHENFYPLRVVKCEKCNLIQLDHTVSKETMFSDHTYLSGITKTLKNNFLAISQDIIASFNIKEKKSILDIGSNDGTFLSVFKEIGWNILGVESSKNIAEIANDNGIKTINQFFNYGCAKNINQKFDFINASGVFFHLEELHSVTEGIKYLLKSEGVFIVQFIYLGNILKHTAFDQIYHEHLLYYSLDTLSKLLAMYDLEIFDGYMTDVHGGQMVCYISHKGKYKVTNRILNQYNIESKMNLNHNNTYEQFKREIIKLKNVNIKFLELNKQKLIYGFGAPVKGNTLLNFFGINTSQIKYLVEKNKLRKNLFAPGSGIPIIMEDDVEKYPDIYYVLAWNFKKEILKNNQDLINKHKIEFYFPINV